jgi:hypothetical protein
MPDPVAALDEQFEIFLRKVERRLPKDAERLLQVAEEPQELGLPQMYLDSGT